MLKSRLSNRQKALPRVLLNLCKGEGLSKTLNWLRYDWRVLKSTKVKYTPPIMAATITEACNLRCSTCLYMLEDEEYLSSGLMTIDNFRAELYSKKAHLSDTLFLSGGEPLLHPELEQFIDIGHEYGLKVKTSTNGILLWENRNILRKIEDINVSLDSWDYDSFNKYRGGSREQYKKIIKGLKTLNGRSISYSISFLLASNNVKHIHDMLLFASYYRPHTVHFHNINPHGSYVKPIIKGEDKFKYIEEITNRRMFNFDIVISHMFDPGSKEFWGGKCVQPWFYHCWNSKGFYSPCCHLPHNYYEEGELEGFRDNMLFGDNLPAACLYCQRRFLGKNYAVYSERKGKWMF